MLSQVAELIIFIFLGFGLFNLNVNHYFYHSTYQRHELFYMHGFINPSYRLWLREYFDGLIWMVGT